MNNNKICQLLKIQYPIIQGGMVWVSGAKLAAAVSNAGGLGLLGSGSMPEEVLREHIRKAKSLTSKPFGVNVPMMYSKVDRTIAAMEEEGVKIIFTSAGNPATFTPELKKRGFTVVHVVSSVRFAKKAEQAGVDAVVAEGFEAGGHNGREETSTMVLTAAVSQAVKIPVISAGGIASGRAMAAAMALGAAGVQIGSLFVVANESSAHENFVQAVLDAQEGDTMLSLKEISPTRLLKGGFFNQVQDAYKRCASVEELTALLGKGRAKAGIFCG
ncbi:MAG: DUF561 domain-containing protein, partial [Flavobacteriales bacterium]|nr:DUF561 domain-containing protein [Flavobacteriales bacterium]